MNGKQHVSVFLKLDLLRIFRELKIFKMCEKVLLIFITFYLPYFPNSLWTGYFRIRFDRLNKKRHNRFVLHYICFLNVVFAGSKRHFFVRSTKWYPNFQKYKPGWVNSDQACSTWLSSQHRNFEQNKRFCQQLDPERGHSCFKIVTHFTIFASYTLLYFRLCIVLVV